MDLLIIKWFIRSIRLYLCLQQCFYISTPDMTMVHYSYGQSSYESMFLQKLEEMILLLTNGSLFQFFPVAISTHTVGLLK
jgi:hypothetical protein